jgi:hypothetical protein
MKWAIFESDTKEENLVKPLRLCSKYRSCEKFNHEMYGK